MLNILADSDVVSRGIHSKLHGSYDIINAALPVTEVMKAIEYKGNALTLLIVEILKHLGSTESKFYYIAFNKEVILQCEEGELIRKYMPDATIRKAYLWSYTTRMAKEVNIGNFNNTQE